LVNELPPSPFTGLDSPGGIEGSAPEGTNGWLEAVDIMWL